LTNSQIDDKEYKCESLRINKSAPMVSKENLLKLLDEITAAYLKENGLAAGALGGVTQMVFS